MHPLKLSSSSGLPFPRLALCIRWKSRLNGSLHLIELALILVSLPLLLCLVGDLLRCLLVEYPTEREIVEVLRSANEEGVGDRWPRDFVGLQKSQSA